MTIIDFDKIDRRLFNRILALDLPTQTLLIDRNVTTTNIDGLTETFDRAIDMVHLLADHFGGAPGVGLLGTGYLP